MDTAGSSIPTKGMYANTTTASPLAFVHDPALLRRNLTIIILSNRTDTSPGELGETIAATVFAAQ